MKKLTGFLCAMLLVFGVVGTVNAGLQTIGTATYGGSNYNLIYEDDSIDGGLVWLDYTNSSGTWYDQMSWASSLNGNLTVNLDSGYTTDIDWSTGWRLPLTQGRADIHTYNQTGSEMGHLYYESLGNIAFVEPEWSQPVNSDFDNLQYFYYWSGTTWLYDPDTAWLFSFYYGKQGVDSRDYFGYRGIAVRPGNVSAVPIPSAIWLLGSGLIGLVGFRRKFRKA